MRVTSLSLKDDQYQEVRALAEFYGESVAVFMQQIILERLEDESDYHDVVGNLKESHGQTVSRNAIKRRLDLIGDQSRREQ